MAKLQSSSIEKRKKNYYYMDVKYLQNPTPIINKQPTSEYHKSP